MTERLPLFPLGHTVLFPGVALPLHVFEDRYRELVRTLVEQDSEGARRFGVVAIRQGWEVGEDAARALHPVGCAADLRRVSRYPDGRYDIVTVGADRFRLVDVDRASRPYLVGEVEWLPADPPAVDAGPLARVVRELFAGYERAISATGGAQIRQPPELPEDPSVLSYLVAANSMFPLEDRQALLEAADAVTRLRSEARLLKRETTMLRRLRALPVSLAELQVSRSLS